MRPSAPFGEVLNAVAARFGDGGEVSSPGAGGLGGWAATVASLLAVVLVGNVAARLARRLMRNSTPELIVLLDQSAAFYSRWPEDRLASVPRGELMIEAARCARIIELLETPAAVVEGSGSSSGAVGGLRTWIAVLHRQIEDGVVVPAGPAFA
jgi:hypothetical protein